MKLITRNTDYAVTALRCIALNENRIISVTDLVKKLKIPRAFLRKVLQILNKNGILKSYKGQGGGFLLAVPANKIFLVDLIEILQGPLKLNECIFKKKICPDRNICILRKKLVDIERDAIAELKSVTIASLLRDGSQSYK